ncbi:EGF-like repeat and discoidin I-like domain-containing protein 3 [Acropora millepora]|uniref:EGF-like repeat and discoidin I-like domain-containing protein 3 n=1 Tax=Acropora millepora TaxID=45264 RepID=UPI001CF31783|nr:EGF-like repeat and discoidin I-like domain-containing protein 3 [Acropora millepora]
MWPFRCSLWVLFLSVSVQSGLGLNPSNKCNTALGLEDLRIQDSQLTAQSHFESLSIGGGKSVDTEPKCARLNKNNCAWCAPHGNGQYLQVDLRRDVKITGIATQGFEALSDYYVKRYKVSHSRDGYTWSTFPEWMRGNHDGRSVVRHNFSSPIYARYIRVYPVAYRYRICMRMELYGYTNCSSAVSTIPSPKTQSAANNAAAPENVSPTIRTTATPRREFKPVITHSTSECNSALGLEDLRIQDSQLTAQSYYESLSIGGSKSVDTEPKCARLNKNNCAWCAPRGNGQYLQVDLRRGVNITGIATQGFEALSNYYVKRYRVSHSRNGLTWSIFHQVMKGNRDGRSVVRHNFIPPVYARYIRVYPKTYRYRICMRMELYGC